jgi:GxxExxY protein
MNRRGAETRSFGEITEQVIGAGIEIHKQLGPGLLESAYEECLCYELSALGLRLKRQEPLPARYKGVSLDCGYRLDLIVEDRIILELIPLLKNGIRRLVNNYVESPASPRLRASAVQNT